jgi:hypothetical protein
MIPASHRILRFHNTLVLVRRLRAAINRPWNGGILRADTPEWNARRNEVENGRGYIAQAYDAAALLEADLGIPPQKGATVTRIY